MCENKKIGARGDSSVVVSECYLVFAVVIIVVVVVVVRVYTVSYKLKKKEEKKKINGATQEVMIVCV